MLFCLFRWIKQRRNVLGIVCAMFYENVTSILLNWGQKPATDLEIVVLTFYRGLWTIQTDSISSPSLLATMVLRGMHVSRKNIFIHLQWKLYSGKNMILHVTKKYGRVLFNVINVIEIQYT